ncbi:PqqD family protein [Anabaena sp. UHCC 0187]|uniref:PqqD family protein n=1 Tax=Anabaena sp. UHCC 0187 TaxID=2590018 RepID=UPI001444A7FC|nr:PqqD family protein [Anabaena sp. UHCC 0187]MTJ11800.1 PqqD family protein [Anabaena sp. UHCC 0187]
MNLSEKFKINVPKVVHEMIEGEVVIVNLDGGEYYSLVTVGADIWEKLARGLSRGEILAEMVSCYDSNSETIATAVNNLITELQRESLISIDATDSENQTHTNNDDLPTQAIEKLKFEPPTLNKYTDMEELLALDPIHDVEPEMGWPSAKV